MCKTFMTCHKSCAHPHDFLDDHQNAPKIPPKSDEKWGSKNTYFSSFLGVFSDPQKDLKKGLKNSPFLRVLFEGLFLTRFGRLPAKGGSGHPLFGQKVS